MASRAVLLRPARDVTRPSVQHLRAAQAPRPAVTQPPPSDGHSVAVLSPCVFCLPVPSSVDAWVVAVSWLP